MASSELTEQQIFVVGARRAVAAKLLDLGMQLEVDIVDTHGVLKPDERYWLVQAHFFIAEAFRLIHTPAGGPETLRRDRDHDDAGVADEGEQGPGVVDHQEEALAVAPPPQL